LNHLTEKHPWTLWLGTMNDWTHAVTVTFVTCRHGQVLTASIIEDAVKHCLRRIDVACYRGRGRRSKANVGSMVVASSPSVGTHPHAHLALSAPSDQSYGEFFGVIETAIRKTNWFNRQYAIKPYRSDGWISYCIDHGQDGALLECFRRHRD
jgi:hypothetical protein